MNLQQGKPLQDGRYVVYVDGIGGWCEPKILTWRKGAWHYYHSTQQLQENTHGWIGPLPILEMPKPPAQEFDL